ncbi:MAG: KpsF/GutQ family sugar-phosphate isomerase [Bdellovibrionales bacterium]|jgi:arabinose-5-phosphate isomerase|nr:KpsF/GutQ family sugar-phosphate isomerase [Bdellovibrionales bacterium]
MNKMTNDGANTAGLTDRNDQHSEADRASAIRVFEVEARGIEGLKQRLLADAGPFLKAVDLIEKCQGKLVVAGMGKSGLVGRKIAATFSSTGTPSLFLHPAESSHGDMGVIGATDVVMGISYGGETPELEALLRYVNRKGIPLIAVTGKPGSTLGKAGTVTLDVSVAEEACPLGLAPTASTTATLAMGDALAVTTLQRKRFKPEDFAELHPGGTLGRKLLTRVSDVMHVGEAMPLVSLDTPMRDVLSAMTQKEVRGVAGVLDENQALVGIVTDGDLRRRLEKSLNPLDDMARDLMSRTPKTVDASELAERALFMMEQFKIQTLFVVDRGSKEPARPVGLLHFQDLLHAKLR